MERHAPSPAHVSLAAPEVKQDRPAKVRGRNRLRRLLPGMMVPLWWHGDLNRGNRVEIDSYATLDGQVSREFLGLETLWLDRTGIALGAANVFDCEPPLDLTHLGSRAGNVRRPVGRSFDVSLKKSF